MRSAPILALLMMLALLVPSSAQNLIKIENVTADLSYSKTYDGISEGNTLTIKLYLPFTLESLNNTNSNITIVANSSTESTTINLTVNGVAVATNYVISGGSSATWTFPDFASAGVDMNATVLEIVIEAVANNTDLEMLNLTCDDKPVVANFSYTVTEVKVSQPKVTFYEEDSFYTVKQTVNITQNSDVNISDVKVTFAYPENAINEPVLSHNFGTLNSSEYKTLDISFQKRGPYVGEIKNAEEDEYYITTIKIYSPENLTAEMVIDPEERPWSKYFPEFGEVIEVKLNDKEIDYEISSIEMTLDLKKGWNELEVKYMSKVAETKLIPVPVIFEEKKPWWEEEVLGVPVWVWIIAIAVLVIGIVIKFRK